MKKGRDYAIIPAYNESKTIKEVITRLKRNIKAIPVVVDDGSTDSTYNIAKTLGVTVIRHEKNRGKGEAIRTGLGYVLSKKDVRYIAVIDSDMQYPPEEAAKLIERLEEDGVDFVSGFRVPSDIPYANRFGNFVWRISFNILFGADFKDTNCGLIAFNKRAAKVLSKSMFGGYIIDNAMRMDIVKNGLRYGQTHVKVFYGDRAIPKFVKMAFGNLFFIIIEGLKYRLNKI